ncbi:hypothetical protein SNE40_004441 [Patella caerulea]|uniref:VWFA domain-containing protein n=1 Tax=Patella caerulea TaxID=87958 RepID=A0AAN8K320_PATCE
MHSLTLWLAVAALMIAVSVSQDADFGFGIDDNRERQLELERQREREREREQRERNRAQEIYPGCRDKVADIFFILDSSSSIYIEDYFKQRNFVRSIINRLAIDSRFTRVGALTFSDNYRVSFGINEFRDKPSLANAINDQNIPYLSGATNTASAIRYVRENVPFRNDITRAIVVLTDGYSAAPGATASEADQARREGNYLFVIGVGQYTDEREWRAIASDPDDNFMFNITDYRGLDRLQSTIAQRICSLPPLIINRLQSCFVQGNGADVLFVAGPSGASTALPIIKTLVDNIQAQPGQVQMSLQVSSCSDAENIPLSDPSAYCGPNSPNALDDFITLLRRMRANAAELRDRLRTPNQVAVLFIDDQSMFNRYEISQEARNAVRDGVEVYIVDLGVTQNRNFLERMASRRDAVFSVNDRFGGNLEGRLLRRMCDDLNESPFNVPEVPPSK